MLGNWLKTSVLLAGIVALFGAVGAALGGAGGMLTALAIAAVMNVYAYWFSDKAVLSMYNAQELDEQSAPRFYRIVRELAQNAQLPMPKAYIIDEPQPLVCRRYPKAVQHPSANRRTCRPSYGYALMAATIITELR